MSLRQFILDGVFPSHDAAEGADGDLENLGYPTPTARDWV
jgi:hypothetical protein